MDKEKLPNKNIDGTAADYFFGTSIDGTAVSIQSIKNERRSIAVTGIIENLYGQEFEKMSIIYFDLKSFLPQQGGIPARFRQAESNGANPGPRRRQI